MSKRKAPHTRMPWERLRVQSTQGGESVTDKSAAAATDINHIIKQYHRTGEIPQPRKEVAQYADVSDMQGDLTDRLIWAQQQLREAEEAFNDEINKRKTVQPEAELPDGGDNDNTPPQEEPSPVPEPVSQATPG